MQCRVDPVGAGILTVYLRRPDSPNSLLFARSRASHAEPLDLVISDMSAVELKPAVIFRLSGSEKNEVRALRAVTKEVIGIHILLMRLLFGGDILRRFLQRVSLAKSTSAPLQC